MRLPEKFIFGLSRFYCTGFYFGFLPLPGLVGGILGSVLAVIQTPLTFAPRALIVLTVVLLALPAAGMVETKIGRKDPKIIIIDEVAGTLVATILFNDIIFISLGLFFFLLFDRLKPWPANRLQSLSGGLGILLDDLIAGFYALFLMSAISFTILKYF